MARCPFAAWDEISGNVGAFSGGPFKIVHHTTECSSYAGARAAYRAARSDPHFTVDGDLVYQHIDTGVAARSLRNRAGGVETNRDSAIQIEVVAFAGRPKDTTTLATVARLCRWIEAEHAIPQHWPNGAPRWTTNGRDPGGHNRSAATWDAEGGHYGHSQVPENTHWDPGYTPAELFIVTPDAVFDPHAELAASVFAELPEPAASEPAAGAEQIAARVLATVSGAPPLTIGRLTRIQVRVSAGGVDVEVILDGDGRVRGTHRADRGDAKRPRPKRPTSRSGTRR